MRRDASEAAERLLAAANVALAAARASGDPAAKLTVRITSSSGYRGADHQRRLWRGYFGDYYNQTTTARAALPGGPHGDQAVRYMLDDFGIPGRIAAPGYSNHQAGIAIDFQQIRARGHGVRNSTKAAAKRAWKDTWFFRWLCDNASTYNFQPYRKEPWHWEYRPTPTPRPTGATA
jgi:LAS superfamily LD-carboxypeptidase LdcB